jgi:hypothetical protein
MQGAVASSTRATPTPLSAILSDSGRALRHFGGLGGLTANSRSQNSALATSGIAAAVAKVNYGVKLADYDALREALLDARTGVGEDFTPGAREAWTVCYDELSAEMKAAADV